MKGLVERGWYLFNLMLESLIPVCNFLIRICIGWIFFKSGLIKLQSWYSTVLLFTYEYQVPLLSPRLAATLGTFVEVSMPILLLLGLGGRIPAFTLFMLNLISIFSYPFLWSDAGRVALEQHIIWGMLLMVPMTYGTSKFSLDYVLKCAKRGWFARGFSY